MNNFSVRFVPSIQAVGRSLWQRFFAAAEDPFSSYEFIRALEQTNCASARTGWQPHHLLLYHDQEPVGLAIGYIKSHSYGEYVFDWAIAEAYEAHGFNYYPKWLCAVPFTPVTGARLALSEAVDRQQALAAIGNALDEQARQLGWSGWHINFCSQALAEQLQEQGLARRITVQFQWHNQGYRNFDEFCQQLKARKRKNIIKERAAVAKAGLRIEVASGDEITSVHMQALSAFYQRTYLKRSGHLGYLNADFFTRLKQGLSEQLVVICAYDGDNLVAASLFLRGKDTLYGRYWGCLEHYDRLHFELCYYQGIEYCIKERLAHFNGGAQGEHKLARGFTPQLTHSCHRFINSPFEAAIEDFIVRETQQYSRYMQQCAGLSPYKVQ
ncbi:GNAT family N-acetyltransferase [Pseudoalteromonas sp. T1lg75]|uniref:GNAT family N-acetyltransferase n=1 Tax=Pseudoalteromonas sp. T1lg75 TaxID=2077102 RepID=UPI000CF5E156|nr:GNAT family N-acetyltransferase [Pseudoalteromonas sp. T1lg75]